MCAEREEGWCPMGGCRQEAAGEVRSSSSGAAAALLSVSVSVPGID